MIIPQKRIQRIFPRRAFLRSSHTLFIGFTMRTITVVSKDNETGKFKARRNHCPSILTGEKESTASLLLHMKKHPDEVKAVVES